MLSRSLILRALAAATALAAVARSQNCPHGLTANDIASNSGVDLTGKVALVTGGRSGLGFAISEALLRVGCKVVIASRKEAENRQAVEDLRTAVNGADVSYMLFDLESFESVRAFASEFVGNESRLDYYFGNAGQGAFGKQNPTVDGYERIFQVNYVSQVLLLELLLPLMRKSQPARVILTASSTHTTACGSLGLSSESQEEDQCWGDDGGAISMLPDVDNFQCGPLFGSYPLTKFLITQLARETSAREADAGNQVYAYSFAPGNIYTDLNTFATCCIGPIDAMTPCRYQLPYVGPTDDDGNPDPPRPAVQNHWTSPAHGAMAAVYAALKVNATEESSGEFYATYWECKAEKGYFPQGITPESRAELHDLSLEWAGVTKTPGAGTTATAAPPTVPATTGMAETTTQTTPASTPVETANTRSSSGAISRESATAAAGCILMSVAMMVGQGVI